MTVFDRYVDLGTPVGRVARAINNAILMTIIRWRWVGDRLRGRRYPFLSKKAVMEMLDRCTERLNDRATFHSMAEVTYVCDPGMGIDWSSDDQSTPGLPIAPVEAIVEWLRREPCWACGHLNHTEVSYAELYCYRGTSLDEEPVVVEEWPVGGHMGDGPIYLSDILP